MISYGFKPNKSLLLSYGFVEPNNPVDETHMRGLLDEARSELGARLGAAASDSEWGRRIAVAGQGGMLQRCARCRVDRAGVSGEAAVALRVLLSDPAEFVLLAKVLPAGGPSRQGPRTYHDGSAVQVSPAERHGMQLSVETEEAVLRAAIAACKACLLRMPTALEEDIRLLEQGGVTGARRVAVQYRVQRKQLLQAAVQHMRTATELNRCFPPPPSTDQGRV